MQHWVWTVRNQKSVVRTLCQVGSGKSEGRMSEVGSQKLKVGSRKSEVGSRKSEVGSWKLEVGSRKTLLGFRTSQSLNNNIVVCNRAGWVKNWTDFKSLKRKGGLQAVYLQLTIQRWRERERESLMPFHSLERVLFIFQKPCFPLGHLLAIFYKYIFAWACFRSAWRTWNKINKAKSNSEKCNTRAEIVTRRVWHRIRGR